MQKSSCCAVRYNNSVTETLLQTKLHIPLPRANFVPRPRLIAQLDQGLQQGSRLALVCAPAGFGKTTLVCAWAAQQEPPIAYLSLDEADNDLQRFLAYFVAALQTVQPDLGEMASTMLRSPEGMAPDAILTALINDIDALEHTIVLILDDLHLVSDPDVHHALAYLLEHMPPQLHLVTATRADPPLPLAKLRARGQMVELREADLRFTREEAVQFLGQIMDLELGSEEMAILHGRTEGWPAGLQMAALSMQGREQLADFVTDFSGSHEYVVDYLTGEVLARQSGELEAFLLQTSILERLCGPLCDAVTGQTGSRQRLEQLKAANLFIIPLDDRRRWYRYHRLFADLLRQRLFQRQADLVPELQRRASIWLAENGLPFAAIQHALEAGEGDRAADLIESVIRQPGTWSNLNARTLMAWLTLLPEPILAARPILRLYQARTFTVQGQVNKGDAILQALEQELRQTKLDGGDLLEQVVGDRVSNAMMRGELRRAIAYAEQSLAELPQEKVPARMRLEAILGMACYQLGDVERAGRAYARAVAGAQTVDVPVVTASLKTGQAKVNILKGRLHEAAGDCEEACRLAEVDHVRTAAAGPALSTWAEILTEQNDLQQAQALLAEGIELLRKHAPGHGLATAYTVQARIQQAGGQYEAAFKMLRQAEQLVQGQPLGPLSRRIPAQRARLWLAAGDLAAAAHWAEDFGAAAAGEYLGEYEELTFARVLLANDRPDMALAILESLLAGAEGAGRQGSVVEILALHGLALAAAGRNDEAQQQLARSLTLARPQGYARVYIDEGPPMALLLQETAAAGQEPAYARQLLGAFSMAEAGQPLLVEPLSQRELQVLQLVERGLTNRQIAAELFISLATVKSHTGNIYSKLGVRSRTQALAKAHALQIL